jgi:hypothetical protein
MDRTRHHLLTRRQAQFAAVMAGWMLAWMAAGSRYELGWPAIASSSPTRASVQAAGLSLPAAAAPSTRSAQDGSVRVDCDFAGGNILVDGIDGDRVRLRQDLRDTDGWWFYWSFRVRGAQGRKLRFEFTDGDPIGVRGPAVSADGGKTWRWLGADAGDVRSFAYAFPAGAAEGGDVRFAFTIPYQQADWDRFCQANRDNPRLRPDVLCTSRHGRKIPCLYVAASTGQPTCRVLLTSRHHACETLATYAVEGLLAAVLKPAGPSQRWLGRNVEFLAVPLMDLDGVEEGDQGKNRKPRDHNRDYEGPSIYPEVAALRKLVPAWSAGKPLVAMDIHCPWIRGGRNQVVHIIGSPYERNWAQQQRFGEILERLRRGPVPYRAVDNLPFGQDWNKDGPEMKGKKTCSRWAAELPNSLMSMSLELPYADARGAEVNAAAARQFGQDLAAAMGEYLQQHRETEEKTTAGDER